MSSIYLILSSSFWIFSILRTLFMAIVPSFERFKITWRQAQHPKTVIKASKNTHIALIAVSL